MQIQLTGQQAHALLGLLAEHSGGFEVLLTAQGENVYVAMREKSFTIYANGAITEEDFG